VIQGLERFEWTVQEEFERLLSEPDAVLKTEDWYTLRRIVIIVKYRRKQLGKFSVCNVW
jgi:hypothetical protein